MGPCSTERTVGGPSAGSDATRVGVAARCSPRWPRTRGGHEDDRGQGLAATGPPPPLRTHHLRRRHHRPESSHNSTCGRWTSEGIATRSFHARRQRDHSTASSRASAVDDTGSSYVYRAYSTSPIPTPPRTVGSLDVVRVVNCRAHQWCCGVWGRDDIQLTHQLSMLVWVMRQPLDRTGPTEAANRLHAEAEPARDAKSADAAWWSAESTSGATARTRTAVFGTDIDGVPSERSEHADTKTRRGTP